MIFTTKNEFTDYEYYGRVTKLPTFKGYTVDPRLKQFRRAEYGKALEFIEFDTLEGWELLIELLEAIPHDGRLFYELLAEIAGL